MGTPEDSLGSVYRLTPRSPKKDIITFLLNANKSLRYGCQLDTPHPEDKDRRFILSYSLSDGSIKIIELAIPNSGIVGGKFLSSRKLVLPGSNPNRPDYYTPKDLYIGALVKVFASRFLITSADLYVYRYMQAHPELFSPEVIDNVRLYHLKEGNLTQDIQVAIREDHEKYLKEHALKAMMERVTDDMITGERIPNPYTGEDEIKKNYHEKFTAEIPCNINIKQDETIPSETRVVRFLEPHEEK